MEGSEIDEPLPTPVTPDPAPAASKKSRGKQNRSEARGSLALKFSAGAILLILGGLFLKSALAPAFADQPKTLTALGPAILMTDLFFIPAIGCAGLALYNGVLGRTSRRGRWALGVWLTVIAYMVARDLVVALIYGFGTT